MSSERMVRIHSVESLRFPGEGLSSQGKSGTKVRPKDVAEFLNKGYSVRLMILSSSTCVGLRYGHL